MTVDNYIDDTTRIADLTVGQLVQIIRTTMQAPAENTMVSGIKGIAGIFGVSYSTAKRIKASGVIDAAISQSGGVIVTDVQKARALYEKATHGRRNTQILFR